MIKKLLLVLSTVFFLGNTALAADSKSNRKDSLVFVGITPVGGHIATILSMPVLTAGLFLGEKLMLGIEGGSNVYPMDEDDVEVEFAYSNIGGYLRLFAGNSFYFSGAVNQRVFTGTATGTDDYGYEVELEVEAATIVGALGIGNQWMTDFGLTFGFDWLVLSGPINASTSIKLKRINAAYDLAEYEEDTKNLKEDLDDINVLSAMPGAVVFTIGWAF